MAVSTTKTNPNNNNLPTTLLLPFIIAISLILTQLTYQNIKNQATYNTKDASYTLTKIDTEALKIREDLANKTAKEGFKAVGDYAMAQASKGDKAWEDGGVKKTVAHAIVGATVAAIGNGDALSGAAGAAAAEATREITKNKDKTTQQAVSTLIGAAVGKGTGASVALKGEKFNRQLHQKEIKWLKDKKNIQAFIKYYQQKTGKTLNQDEAQKILAEGGVSLVDRDWNNQLGKNKSVSLAKEFIKGNYKDNSVLFYGDKDGMQHITYGFNPNEDEYNNRYAKEKGSGDSNSI